MPNIFSDIKTAVKLTGAVRKAQKAGASGVQVKPVYTVPIINTGYWGWTMESCLFYNKKWKPIAEAFKGLPKDVQHAPTFAPEQGEWADRVRF